MKARINRIMIAGMKSGSGKTTITCGLLKLLVNKGLKTASFKCGPDYIDPMFHQKVLGVKSGNLDGYFMNGDVLDYLLWKNTRNQDIAVLEGVMGYYDGVGLTTKGSSYEVSKITDTPVVLVIDCKGMGNSIGAVLHGFLTYQTNKIEGVIFNRLPERLYDEVKKLAESFGIRSLGYVPQNKEFELESRHLGLVTADEIKDLSYKFDKIAEILSKTIDMDGILEIARGAAELSVDCSLTRQGINDLTGNPDSKIRLAVAKDEAFCFIYRDNLELLEELGCQLIYFSPLDDRQLPENVQGLLLYGGYPELYARELAQNESMKVSIKEAIAGGLPTIAECGGFMYLHEQLENKEHEVYQMAGVIGGKCFPTSRLQRFGYITLTAKTESLLLEKGSCIKAHEFHYWDSEQAGADFLVKKAGRDDNWQCGYGKEHLYAGYPHIHFYSDIRAAWRFVNQCRLVKQERES